MGSWFEAATDGVDDAYQSVAGAADHAAGSTDEAWARQFDQTEGGGLVEGFGEELGSDQDSFLTRGSKGLYSLVDDEPGNVAGPGDEEWETAKQAAEDGYLGSSNIQRTIILAAVVVGGALFLKEFAGGVGEGVVS